MNEILYLNDSYLRNWTAKVVSVKDEKFVVLDRTAFYPESGGQPCDYGLIRKNGDLFKIVFVKKISGIISHELDKSGLNEGDIVECEIDWVRRNMMMRMHTASHILSAVIFRTSDAKITGNQLGIEQSRMDFSMTNYSQEKLHAFVEEANREIQRNLSVSHYFISCDDALKKPELARLAKGLPENIKIIRVVKIGDVDEQADGGTHVKNTSEIGKIRFVKSENKGKDNRRLYFVLEN